MYVTRHAKKRLHERDGTKKSAVYRKASLVYERGYRVEETKGRLRRWVDSNRGSADNLRVYGDKLYIFNGETLITVYQIPHEIRKRIRKYIRGGAMHKRTKACAIPMEVKKRVFERDKERCIFCGRPGEPVAHIIPRSRGGLGVEQNIITACRECHQAMDNGTYRDAFLNDAIRYIEKVYGEFDREKVTYRKEIG